MDPISNSTPTPAPTPTPTPTPAPEPTPAAEPVAPAPAPAAPVAPEPVAPAGPEPVATGIATPATEPLAANSAFVNPTQVNPVYQPTNNRVKATDPIMMPEPAPEPDPIEEELKAPMKAADPVPGSIGSAISGAPAENPNAAATPSVAFNDPAVQPETNSSEGAGQTPAAKKPVDKKTLYILIGIAAVIVVALVIVLIMQLSGGSSSGSGSGSQTSNIEPEPEPEPEPENKVLSCSRDMTAEELITVSGALSGTIDAEIEFDDEGDFVSVLLEKSVVYDGATEPTVLESREATAKNLKVADANLYNIPVSENEEMMLTLDDIQDSYEQLDFTCEVL